VDEPELPGQPPTPARVDLAEEAPAQAGERSPLEYAAAIYGSILVTALVSSLSEEHADGGAMAVAVLSGMAVFWLAHVWSDAVGERLVDPRPFTARGLWRNARQQWPIVQSAFAPLLALVLVELGVWSLTAGVDVALGAAIVQLVAWGMILGLRSFETWPKALLAGAVDGALGLAIVALKVLVH
jgi:hypothetical protein